jgi:hypothetical protein
MPKIISILGIIFLLLFSANELRYKTIRPFGGMDYVKFDVGFYTSVMKLASSSSGKILPIGLEGGLIVDKYGQVYFDWGVGAGYGFFVSLFKAGVFDDPASIDTAEKMKDQITGASAMTNVTLGMVGGGVDIMKNNVYEYGASIGFNASIGFSPHVVYLFKLPGFDFFGKLYRHM